MDQIFVKLQPLTHNLWRIMLGFMFWVHGGEKLFAWFGREQAVDLTSRLGVAGVLEFFGGLAIILGLFTRPVAFLLSGEMAVAYFWSHVAGRGAFWPWANGGERAAMYCFTFLFMSVIGSGSLSLDSVLKNKKGTVLQGRL